MFGNSVDGLVTPVICVLLFVLICQFLFAGRQYTNLPPGPKPLPFFGNTFQLLFSDVRSLAKEYRKKYGNIYTFYFFSQAVIVVNGYEYLTELFVKNASAVSRKLKNPHRAMFKGEGVVYAEGDIWKHNRRFVLRTLKDFGMGKSKLQTKIHEEISYFLAAVEDYDGQPFDINCLLKNAVSNIIASIVFGKRFHYTDTYFKKLLLLKDAVARTNLPVMPVWVKYIPGDPFQVGKAHRILEDSQKFYRLKVQEHYHSYDNNEIRDFIDAYIKHMKQCKTEEDAQFISENELIRLVHDLFSAGLDTITTAIRFALVHLLRHPDIQEKLRNELSSEVSDNRFPDLTDKNRLPLLQAVILETLRQSVVMPNSGPRLAHEDLEYRGYTIPKSALLLPSVESVLTDEGLWSNPLNFDPTRFLKEGKVLTKVDEWIPFSLGPRTCPGESLAKMEMYLFLGAMLQRFEFLPPDGEDPPNLKRVIAAIDTPQPFELRAVKRQH